MTLSQRLLRLVIVWRLLGFALGSFVVLRVLPGFLRKPDLGDFGLLVVLGLIAFYCLAATAPLAEVALFIHRYLGEKLLRPEHVAELDAEIKRRQSPPSTKGDWVRKAARIAGVAVLVLFALAAMMEWRQATDRSKLLAELLLREQLLHFSEEMQFQSPTAGDLYRLHGIVEMGRLREPPWAGATRAVTSSQWWTRPAKPLDLCVHELSALDTVFRSQAYRQALAANNDSAQAVRERAYEAMYKRVAVALRESTYVEQPERADQRLLTILLARATWTLTNECQNAKWRSLFIDLLRRVRDEEPRLSATHNLRGMLAARTISAAGLEEPENAAKLEEARVEFMQAGRYVGTPTTSARLKNNLADLYITAVLNTRIARQRRLHGGPHLVLQSDTSIAGRAFRQPLQVLALAHSELQEALALDYMTGGFYVTRGQIYAQAALLMHDRGKHARLDGDVRGASENWGASQVTTNGAFALWCLRGMVAELDRAKEKGFPIVSEVLATPELRRLSGLGVLDLAGYGHWRNKVEQVAGVDLWTGGAVEGDSLSI